jgi:hypothetical protein
VPRTTMRHALTQLNAIAFTRKPLRLTALAVSLVVLAGCTDSPKDELSACKRMVGDGLREVADKREDRFLGKVQSDTAIGGGV